MCPCHSELAFKRRQLVFQFTAAELKVSAVVHVDAEVGVLVGERDSFNSDLIWWGRASVSSKLHHC